MDEPEKSTGPSGYEAFLPLFCNMENSRLRSFLSQIILILKNYIYYFYIINSYLYPKTKLISLQLFLKSLPAIHSGRFSIMLSQFFQYYSYKINYCDRGRIRNFFFRLNKVVFLITRFFIYFLNRIFWASSTNVTPLVYHFIAWFK